MSITYGNKFVSGFQVQSTASQVYLVSSSVTGVVVSNARAVNHTTDSHTLTLWMIPNSETEADNFKAIVETTLDPKETLPLTEIIGEPLLSGGQILAQSDADNVISLTIGGSVNTP